MVMEMDKLMAKAQYYNIKSLLDKNTQYNMVMGEHDHGKNYHFKKQALEEIRDNCTEETSIDLREDKNNG